MWHSFLIRVYLFYLDKYRWGLHCKFLEYWNTQKSVWEIWQHFSKNTEEIEFLRWLFEGPLRQGKNVPPDGLNWLCYFAGSSKSHRKNSISFIFLESTHQVDVKNIVKHFFGYFNTLEAHSGTACSTHVHCSNIVRRFLKGLPFFVVFVWCAKNIKFRNSAELNFKVLALFCFIELYLPM